MSRGPDDIIREYLEANASVPAIAAFNVMSWQEIAEEILEAIEAEQYLTVHRDCVRTYPEMLAAAGVTRPSISGNTNPTASPQVTGGGGDPSTT